MFFDARLMSRHVEPSNWCLLTNPILALRQSGRGEPSTQAEKRTKT